MKNNDNWKIYIVGHKKIHSDLMAGDKQFNNENYVFLNCSYFFTVKMRKKRYWISWEA